MFALMSFFYFTIVVGVLCGVHGSSFYKQPVLTIKTEKGQVYDCVDFNRQPAFNTSLKKQIHELKPTYLQNQVREVKNLGLKDGCSLGTVPILRSMNILKSPSNSTGNGEHCTAVIRTKGNVGRYFFGATGSVSIYQSRVEGNQWSSSRMKFVNGPDSIEAGWMVNPALFEDTEAHLYAKFTAGPKGCLNLLCPGFVQVSKDVPLGAIPIRYTHIGDSQIYFWQISIEQHQDDGNWWLSMGSDKKPIGYWPKSLFTALGVAASQIEWGGEIYNPESATIPQPYMGSGLTARDDIKQSALYFHVKAVEGHQRYDPPKDTQKYENCRSYTTYDAGNQGYRWGRLIYYGGPNKAM